MDDIFEGGDFIDEGVRLRIICLIEWNGQEGRIASGVGIAGVVEEAEAGVILLMPDRIVGMAVALDATHGKSLENLPRSDVAIHRGEQAELLVVGAALTVCLGQAVEGGGEFLIQRGAGYEIAGELVDDELVVRQIPVERIDDPIAIFPNIAVCVVAKAFGIGVAREIHPDGSPALTEVRGGEQAVGLGGDRGGEIFCSGGLEGIELSKGRRQADEIEGSAAQPLGGHCLRGWSEVFRLQLGEDEMIDVVGGPRSFFYRRRIMPLWWDERPMLAPLCSLGDPLAQRFHIAVTEARAVIGLGHQLIGIFTDDPNDHFRFIGFPRYDNNFVRLAFS